MRVSGVFYMLKSHTMLSLMILGVPFYGTPALGSNFLGITGLKPINIIAASVFALWLLKGGDVLRYTSLIRFRATMVYFVYIAVFSIEFFRSFSDISILADRSDVAFARFSDSSFGFILSNWIKPILVTGSFLYIINFIGGKDRVEATVDVLLLSFILFAIATLPVGVPVMLTDGNRSELVEQFSETFGFHYNTLSSILMISIPLALSRVNSGRKIWIVGFTVILVALLTSQSRGAIVGAGVGSLVFFYLQRRISFSTVAAFSIIGVVGLWLFEPLQSLFSIGVESGNISEISSGRIDNIWIPLLNEILDNPYRLIFGYGLFGIILTDSYVTLSYIVQAGHAHNAFLNLLIDGGVLVIFPFFALLIFCLRKAFLFGLRYSDSTYHALLSSVCIYLISCMTGRHFFPSIDNLMMFPVIALMLVIVMDKSKRSKPYVHIRLANDETSNYE